MRLTIIILYKSIITYSNYLFVIKQKKLPEYSGFNFHTGQCSGTAGVQYLAAILNVVAEALVTKHKLCTMCFHTSNFGNPTYIMVLCVDPRRNLVTHVSFCYFHQIL